MLGLKPPEKTDPRELGRQALINALKNGVYTEYDLYSIYKRALDVPWAREYNVKTPNLNNVMEIVEELNPYKLHIQRDTHVETFYTLMKPPSDSEVLRIIKEKGGKVAESEVIKLLETKGYKRPLPGAKIEDMKYRGILREEGDYLMPLKPVSEKSTSRARSKGKRGWFGESERHSIAAKKGWQKRLAKLPRYSKEQLLKIQAERGRGGKQDKKKRAKKTLKPDDPRVAYWVKHPDRYDVEGVDTP